MTGLVLAFHSGVEGLLVHLHQEIIMCRSIRWIGPALLLTAVACSGDTSTGSSNTSYDTVDGTYVGTMSGLSQGVALNATFSLTINQSSGAISGSYALQGTLNNGVTTISSDGTGSFTGAIAAGNNPSVNMTILVPGCPNYSAHYSGSYDSTNHRMTITGPVDMLDVSCAVELSYQTTLVLNR